MEKKNHSEIILKPGELSSEATIKATRNAASSASGILKLQNLLTQLSLVFTPVLIYF